GVALVIGCGGLADVALKRAAQSGVAVKSAPDSPSAAKIAVFEVRAGDAVLVKASRGVAAEVVVEALVSARGEAQT
ncbi:MAG: UDP-N-acetylmuramoylalanyl-D-glutamyl-2, 6-diaminopimelate--D-alanyl-D-alanine ligase, partial [Polyangiaceae bacterium]